jgi:hypothetical protein
MAALGIGAELRLVDADERRHRARAASLSIVHRNQRALGGRIFSSPVISATCVAALDRDDAVIDFARQQAQREADHAAGMGAHPLDCQMRLAGVGGPSTAVISERAKRLIAAPRSFRVTP